MRQFYMNVNLITKSQKLRVKLLVFGKKDSNESTFLFWERKVFCSFKSFLETVRITVTCSKSNTETLENGVKYV